MKKAGLGENRIRSRYGEYPVALKLAENGHTPKLLDERSNKSADIHLAHINKKVNYSLS